MHCFPCFQSQRSKKSNGDQNGPPSGVNNEPKRDGSRKAKSGDGVENINVAAKAFTFRELATATKNFRQECLLGEGGFGRVFKGTLASTGQVVAVKQLDRNGLQGDNKEFLNEVSSLGLLNHPNLLSLIGYCADGDQRLLVFEFMSGSSLDDHLFVKASSKEPLDWSTRIKIAFGAAKGVEYLHCKANPPVVYHNIKPSNILLDEDFNPKIADFGLSKLGSGGDNKLFGPSRVVGTFGYSAPECARGGDHTTESDVYIFGVILLQLITGRKAMDTTRPNDEQNLVHWAQPMFKDPKHFPDMADPLLRKQFPEKDLNQAVAIAAMCLQEEPAARPLMSDVVTTLSFLWLTAEKYIPTVISPSEPPSNKELTSHDQPKPQDAHQYESDKHEHKVHSKIVGEGSERANSGVHQRQTSQRKKRVSIKQTSFANDDDNSEYDDSTSEEEEEEYEEGSSEEEYDDDDDEDDYYDDDEEEDDDDNDDDDYEDEDEDEEEDEEEDEDNDDEEYESSEDEDQQTNAAQSKNLHKSNKKLNIQSHKSRKESFRLRHNSRRDSRAYRDDRLANQKSRAKSSKHGEDKLANQKSRAKSSKCGEDKLANQKSRAKSSKCGEDKLVNQKSRAKSAKHGEHKLSNQKSRAKSSKHKPKSSTSRKHKNVDQHSSTIKIGSSSKSGSLSSKSSKGSKARSSLLNNDNKSNRGSDDEDNDSTFSLHTGSFRSGCGSNNSTRSFVYR